MNTNRSQEAKRHTPLTEEQVRDPVDAEEETLSVRVRESLADYKAGRVRRFNSAEELLQTLNQETSL